jgi:hypothetical protein
MEGIPCPGSYSIRGLILGIILRLEKQVRTFTYKIATRRKQQ